MQLNRVLIITSAVSSTLLIGVSILAAVLYHRTTTLQSLSLQAPPSISEVESSFNNLTAVLGSSPVTSKLLDSLKAFELKKSSETYAPLTTLLFSIVSKPLASNFIIYANNLKRKNPSDILIGSFVHLVNGYSHYVNAMEFIEFKLDETIHYISKLEYTHSSIKTLVDFATEIDIANVKPNFLNELYLYSSCMTEAETLLNKLWPGKEKSHFKGLHETVFQPLKLHYASNFIAQKHDRKIKDPKIAWKDIEMLDDEDKGNKIRSGILYRFEHYFKTPPCSLDSLLESEQNEGPKYTHFTEFIKAIRGDQFRFIRDREDIVRTLDYRKIFEETKWKNIRTNPLWVDFEKDLGECIKRMKDNSFDDQAGDEMIMRELDAYFFFNEVIKRNINLYPELAKEVLDSNFEGEYEKEYLII
jgi:hypothetical protein